jgi:hypothetical protein
MTMQETTPKSVQTHWFWQTLALMGVLVGLLGYLAWIYQQVYIKEQLSRFVENANEIVFFEPIEGIALPPSNESGITIEMIKQHAGNRLELARSSFLKTENKYLIDPFQPRQNLPLLYGVVRHPVKIDETQYDLQSPVWFTYSPGPSGERVQMQIIRSSNQPEHYQFVSPPYDTSNGLRSQGYVYADSQGLRFGKVKR